MIRPVLQGIHHVKLTVSDLDRSLSFYERALGARRLSQFDHRRPDGSVYAYILEVGGLGTALELRFSPDAARAEAGQDHLTLAVGTHDELAAWHAHFEAAHLPHSPLLTGMIGWLVVLEDPDRRRIRFYTRETHEPGVGMSHDPYWLGSDHETPRDSALT